LPESEAARPVLLPPFEEGSRVAMFISWCKIYHYEVIADLKENPPERAELLLEFAIFRTCSAAAASCIHLSERFPGPPSNKVLSEGSLKVCRCLKKIKRLSEPWNA
jgi:hypothetical protein